MSTRLSLTITTIQTSTTIRYSVNGASSGASVFMASSDGGPDVDRWSIDDRVLIFFLIVLATVALAGCSRLCICLNHNPNNPEETERSRVHPVSVNCALSPLPSGTCSITYDTVDFMPGNCILIGKAAASGRLSGQLYSDVRCFNLNKDPLTRDKIVYKIKIVEPAVGQAVQVGRVMQTIQKKQYRLVSLYGLDSAPAEPVLLVLSKQHNGYVCAWSEGVRVPKGSTVFEVRFIVPEVIGREDSWVSI